MNKPLAPKYIKKLAALQAQAEAAPPITEEMRAELAQVGAAALRSPKERTARKRGHWRHQAAKRHACKLQRTPGWADLDQIRAIHVEAQRLATETGIAHHVDHVIPLQGRRVSGLHVHTNLQILTGSENSRKHNRFDLEENPAQGVAPGEKKAAG